MEGRRTLAECLSYVMEHFLSEWKEKTDSEDSSYQALREARDYLREFFRDEGYDAKASFGMNQRMHVPWLCLSDPNLGKGASCGLYISYLFQADMEAVHLALCQGVSLLGGPLRGKEQEGDAHPSRRLLGEALPCLRGRREKDADRPEGEPFPWGEGGKGVRPGDGVLDPLPKGDPPG